MSVSAKFFISKVEGNVVSMYPVCRGIENREWASSTPGGNLSLSITNPAALEQFKVGEEYEAIFTHAPRPTPGDGHPVDHYEDHPAYDPSKTIHLCKTCGSYAALNPDGTPDWTAHDERWGSTPEQRSSE